MPMRRSLIVGIPGVFLFVLSILMKFVIIPPIVKRELKEKLSLKNGWPMRDIWSKLPFVIENHVYVFNVTNPMEIANGAKPIIQEVGPFVYDMFQEKVHQSDSEKEDTVSYVMQNTYHYNQMKSHGMSDEVEVYFPHLFILTVATGPLKDDPAKVSFTSRAVDALLDKPESLFYKVKVKTILFDGLAIPCGGNEDYFAKLICNEIRDKYADSLKKSADDVYYASLFGFRNGTTPREKRVRIIRGSKNLRDTGKIVEIDGMKNLSIWKDDRCDAFAGTDGTIFPPLMNRRKKEDISLVYPLICRRLALNYDSEVEYSELKLLRYTSDLGTDGNHVPEDKCYCYTPDTCLKRGMFEVYKCLHVPMIVSNPHFYMADPYYLNRVYSLHPDKEKHLTYVDFDPLTGSPIRAHVRAQYNMEIMPIEKFRLMRNYTYAMLPMIWTDETFVLPDFFVLKIQIGYFLLKLVRITEYLLASVGLALTVVAAYLEQRARKAARNDASKSSVSVNAEAMTMSENGANAALDGTRTTNAVANAGKSDQHSDKNKFNVARLLSVIRPAPLPPAVE